MHRESGDLSVVEDEKSYHSSNIDVEHKVFDWREQQVGGRHWELILLLLIFILGIQIIDVSAQILTK